MQTQRLLLEALCSGSTEFADWLLQDNSNQPSQRLQRAIERAFYGKGASEVDAEYIGQQTPRFQWTDPPGDMHTESEPESGLEDEGGDVGREGSLPVSPSYVTPIVRIGTWNLHMLRLDKVPPEKQKMYAELVWLAVRTCQCDIVAIQEVVGNELVKLLKDSCAPSYKVWASDELANGRGIGGVEKHVFLSRAWLGKPGITQLIFEKPALVKCRGTVATFNLRQHFSTMLQRDTVRVYSLHLNADSPKQHVMQVVYAIMLNERRLSDERVLAVVAGDFNNEEWIDEFNHMPEMYGMWSTPVVLPRHITTTIGLRAFDNIFCFARKHTGFDFGKGMSVCKACGRAPVALMRNKAWEGPDGSWLSDHFLVFTDILLQFAEGRHVLDGTYMRGSTLKTYFPHFSPCYSETECPFYHQKWCDFVARLQLRLL